jgi:hypothetical protein
MVMLLPEVVATTFDGADGTPAGVAEGLAAESAEFPTVVL